MEEEQWIPLDKCKDSHIYRVDARNFSYALYRKDKQAFFGIRYKFGDLFIDYEEHWDVKKPQGTAKPLEICGNFAGDTTDYEAIMDVLKGFEQ